MKEQRKCDLKRTRLCFVAAHFDSKQKIGVEVKKVEAGTTY